MSYGGSICVKLFVGLGMWCGQMSNPLHSWHLVFVLKSILNSNMCSALLLMCSTNRPGFLADVVKTIRFLFHKNSNWDLIPNLDEENLEYFFVHGSVFFFLHGTINFSVTLVFLFSLASFFSSFYFLTLLVGCHWQHHIVGCLLFWLLLQPWQIINWGVNAHCSLSWHGTPRSYESKQQHLRFLCRMHEWRLFPTGHCGFKAATLLALCANNAV